MKILTFALTVVGICFRYTEADCNAYTRVVESCVQGFTFLNIEAKNSVGDNACRIDKFKEDCAFRTFHSFSRCLGESGRSVACADMVKKAFKKEGFFCSYQEIENAIGTCGASFLSCGFLSLIIAGLIAVLYQT